MELTRQNLLRVNDIVSEIERTRASLKRQVAKAERFIEYRRELDDLVLHDASHRLLELLVVNRVEREARDELGAQTGGMRDRLREADGSIEDVRRESALAEARTDEASRQAFEADNSVSALHAELDRLRDRISHLTTRLDSGRNELGTIDVRVGELDSEREGLAERMSGLDTRRAHARGRRPCRNRSPQHLAGRGSPRQRRRARAAQAVR